VDNRDLKLAEPGPSWWRLARVSANRAVVVDPEAPGRLVIRPVADPVPDRGEAVVRVRAISLNRGEVRRADMAAAGWRPGWDLAGEVERASADGSGPRPGARVVGSCPKGRGPSGSPCRRTRSPSCPTR